MKIPPGLLLLGSWSPPSTYRSVEFWSPAVVEGGSCVLDDFPTDVDYGPTANFVAGHLVACQRSACYFFEGMTRSSRMLRSSAESWSVVHVRWEVVEEKFYQRLFSGTPCSYHAQPIYGPLHPLLAFPMMSSLTPVENCPKGGGKLQWAWKPVLHISE